MQAPCRFTGDGDAFTLCHIILTIICCAPKNNKAKSFFYAPAMAPAPKRKREVWRNDILSQAVIDANQSAQKLQRSSAGSSI